MKFRKRLLPKNNLELEITRVSPGELWMGSTKAERERY